MLCQRESYGLNVAKVATLPLMEPFDRIRAARLKRGFSQEELGLAVGFPADQARQRVHKIEKGIVKLSVDLLVKFAEALQADPAALLKDVSVGEVQLRDMVSSESDDTIPLVAYASSGDSKSVVGYVARPPSLRGVRHGYATYAPDAEMEPRYSLGWLLYVNPSKPPRPGRDVLVVRHSGAPIVRQLQATNKTHIVLYALATKSTVEIPAEDIATTDLIVGSDQEG